MRRFFPLLMATFLLTSCAIESKKTDSQIVDARAKAEPSIVLQDELLNEPPEQAQFVIAQSSASSAVEQPVLEGIRQQLLRLGYAEATSRDDANVVVWYGYNSLQTGMRQVGVAEDAWGEQVLPATIASPDSVMPVSFNVQIISVSESRFPGEVIPIWRGEWSSSIPSVNMQEFVDQVLPNVFELYHSERTQSQISAFRQARERSLHAAMNTYVKMVMYRIQSNWRKPKYNVKGKKCEVKIVQSAVGEIKSHELLACDKDRRFRKSIEEAIKESSPLPLPKHELFDRRELILIFQG